MKNRRKYKKSWKNKPLQNNKKHAKTTPQNNKKQEEIPKNNEKNNKKFQKRLEKVFIKNVYIIIKNSFFPFKYYNFISKQTK